MLSFYTSFLSSACLSLHENNIHLYLPSGTVLRKLLQQAFLPNTDMDQGLFERDSYQGVENMRWLA